MSDGLVPGGLAAVWAQLQARAPEDRIEPSITRIQALMDLLGEPQRTYPVIQIAGTNGKTSTARMIDALLRSFGLRTGLFTSPHLVDPTERIHLSGEPITHQRFVATWQDIEPYVQMVDDRSASGGDIPMSTFELLTALAYAAFADAPIDVAVIEVGMGGRWDATNVADAQVAVVTPIGMDHCDYLGETIELIAGEKAGIIKAGGIAVLGEQVPDAATVLLDRCGQVGATVARYGVEFDVLRRDQAVGGQVLTLRGLAGAQVDDIFLPLLGRHQATNAATALAAVEAFLGGGADPLDPICVRQGFAAVTSPGRLEVLAREPTVLVDAAHNSHGMQALAEAMRENFTFDTVVGIVGVLADKDAREMLLALEPIADLLVVTQPGSPRALAVAELHELALEVFGPDRVVGAFSGVDAALAAGIELAGSGQWGDAGVLVTGSIVLVGQVRAAVAGGRQVR